MGNRESSVSGRKDNKCKDPWIFLDVECLRNSTKSHVASKGKRGSLGQAKSGGATKGIWTLCKKKKKAVA